MQFSFSEEQRTFQASTRTFLERECTPHEIRALWKTDTGRSAERWSRLAELGLLGVLVPEKHGGLGMSEIDLVLLLEETGRAALPEPVLDTAAVGVPLLAGLEGSVLADGWLRRVPEGPAVLAVGHRANEFVADAHVADLLLMQHEDELHAVPRAGAELERQPTNDPSRRLFRVTWTPSSDTRVARGPSGRRLLAAALDRGALAAAAQLLGVGQQLVDLAVRYATQREQFGRPIGSFQAVKHMLANVAVRLEFARPVVYRAAFSVARGIDTMGGRETNDVFFTGAHVPAENVVGQEGRAWTQLMAGLNVERLIIAAQSLGLARRALDDALAYVKERKQFGRPIGTFQTIAHRLADLATELECSRLLTYDVATRVDADPGALFPREASMAKLKATETAKRIALEGMQMMGGYGYATEYDMERHVRVTLAGPIYGGTNEIQRGIIAKTLGL